MSRDRFFWWNQYSTSCMCADVLQHFGTAYVVLFRCKLFTCFCESVCYRNFNLRSWNIIPEAAWDMYIYVDFSGIQWGVEIGEGWPMKERKAGSEIRFGGISHSFCLFSIFFRTIHSFIHPFAEGLLLFPHCSSLSRGPPWGAEPGFELGPAGQQADALLSELRRTLNTDVAFGTILKIIKGFS